MKDINLTIDGKECSELAYKIFMDTSGIDREGKKYDRMRTAALKMRKNIESNINIRFVCKYYEGAVPDGRTLTIDGEVFNCSAFEQIKKESVEGTFLYAVCAGDFDMPDKNIMDQLYADIWGTAFADAVRVTVKEYLEKFDSLSDSFGPGFYGMDVSEIIKLDRILDFSQIGIELKGNQVMVPLKSCAGIYFKTNKSYRPLKAACASCLGSHSSCRLCRIYGE